jgi:hypothetical protein
LDFYFGGKLLANLGMEIFYLVLINPLVLIELTGNLHFEGVMLFFLFGECTSYNKMAIVCTINSILHFC